MNIPFGKYHGCGNDFILVQEEDIYPEILEDLIVQCCDRHTGIGADGFIVVRKEPLEMLYYNQDGSRAPMCGNGIRCFAKYCIDEGIVHKKEFTVKTLAGDKVIKALEEHQFEVNMGKPIFDDLSLTKTDSKIWARTLKLDQGQEYTLYTLFQSTIHTVVFVDKLDEDMVIRDGQLICENPLFHEKTNVNFVKVIDEHHIQMQTYERGCGLTLACGTGACASVVCAKLCGLCQDQVQVELPKGVLNIKLQVNGDVYMMGKAQCVAKGEYMYETN